MMKINTKTQYGICTMIELAINDTQSGVFQKEISRRQGISYKYLDQIISSLKSAGLITNVGGRKSGYRLNRPAEGITVYDIYLAFEPGLNLSANLNSNDDEGRIRECPTTGYWQGLNMLIINYLKEKTLKQLAEEQIALNTRFQEIDYTI